MSISNSPQFGTPDWQRGSYSAQKLLTVQPATVASVVVDTPANAESIVLALAPGQVSPIALCVGQTTGIQYTGMQLYGSDNTYRSDTFIFDVSAAVDSQIQIGFESAPGAAWWAYADAGVHLVADMGTRKTPSSAVYTVPTVPSTFGGDHPPCELLLAGNIFNAASTLIPAPASGQRNRIFALTMQGIATAVNGYLFDSASGQPFVGFANSSFGSVQILPTGFAQAEGASVGYDLFAGSGSVICSAIYTIETV